jgi:YHS domain-containing protein
MTMNEPSRGRVIVFGILFWYPLAGVTYQFLHYLIGLRELGFDPYYIEDSGRWLYDPTINDLSPHAEGNLRAVAPILERYGFAGRWGFRGNYPDGQCYGMTESQILQLYRDAEFFLNVTGAQEIRDEHLACRRRIYVESDPFASQVRVAQGDPRTLGALRAHDTLFSFGENLGAPDCDVPVQHFRWLPTRQPVVLDLWRNPYGLDTTAYRTITTWQNKGKNVEYRGDTYYWTKDREFEKFLSLPARRAQVFELAAGVPEDVRRKLATHGWQQVNSVEISANLGRYHEYIQRSRAEFTVARDQYARPNTGWFSDRSACYLAAGRPVVTQETGFSKYLPTGKGLFSFRTLEDVLSAVDEIEGDYAGHCRAARELAHEYFSATKVLGSLLTRAALN